MIGFNITKQAVVARQAEAVPQPIAVAGEPKFEPTYDQRPIPPSWWEEAFIPDEPSQAPGAMEQQTRISPGYGDTSIA